MSEASAFSYSQDGGKTREDRAEGIPRIVRDANFEYFNFQKEKEPDERFMVRDEHTISVISNNRPIEPEYDF